MENNLPVISKKVWSLVRVAFFMLRKGISKGKLMMNLNMILKRRSKLTGKAIANLISHHPHHGGSTSNRHSHQFTSSREYEFRCSNTPNHFFSIGKRHRTHNHNHNNFFTRSNAPSAHDDEVTTVNAMKAMLEMLNNDQAIAEASQANVRQLGVADSSSPLIDEDKKDNKVDKAAEDFIKRFYSQLRKQD
ncbi:unnamed protein product [Lathyrus oleraceus]|nr:uncharacterized protein LOC127087443 [Pisum sativum]